MIKKIPVTLLLLISAGLCAQTEPEPTPTCGTMSHLAWMMEEDPQLEVQMQQYNQQLDNWIAANTEAHQRSANAVITIPVVFHIVYNTTAENISDKEIESQVVAMNKDFMGTNTDLNKVPSAFKSVVANPQIQFCLARRTPTGQPTTGIIRKSTTKTSFSTNNDVKYSSRGGSDAWDTKQYFNIWICNLGSSLLGYAEFPTGTATKTFGYVGHYRYTGTINSRAPYNLGRTTTHEIGHCLNLRHIWGDADCGNDLVADTPTQRTSSSGCPSFPRVSCSNGPNGDMFMNYMDYSDDSCMNMFTVGQTTRMLATINNAPYNALKTSDGCTPPISTGVISITTDNKVSIYPNPNEGIFNVSFNLNEQIGHSLEIRNVLGQVVYKEEISTLNGNYSKAIDIQKFGRGTYTILIVNEHRIMSSKILVY